MIPAPVPLLVDIADALSPLIDMSNFFLDVINAILSGDIQFLAETFLGLILLVPNIILWVIFKATSALTGIFYDLLVVTTTRTPMPMDSPGSSASPVIFREPHSGDVFYELQQVIESSIVPIALIFVVFGIAIVLFIRVFDVILKFNFNSEEAQRRLLVAPILISLWVPLANMVLLFAVGLTDLFLNQVTINTSSLSADVASVYSGNTLDPATMLESGATGGTDLGSNPSDFITGSGSSGSVGVLYKLLAGIYFSIFILPVALIASLLALIRLTLVYVFYVLGPIGIMMWAITWRDIGDLGEKIVRYFILLALFPIPAALMTKLMPIISIGIEEAVSAGISSALGSTASGVLSFIGVEGVTRSLLAGVSVCIIGFAPWALVIGVGKATALAGGAAVAGAGVATGGTALAAGGALSGTMKAASGASKAAGGASKVGSKVGSKASQAIESKTGAISTGKEMATKRRNQITDHADAARDRMDSGRSRLSSEINNVKQSDAVQSVSQSRPGQLGKKYGTKAGDAAKSKAGNMKKSTMRTARAGMDSAKEKYKNTDNLEIAQMGEQKLSKGLQRAGLTQTSRVMDRSFDTVRKGNEAKKRAAVKLDKQRAIESDEELAEDIAGDVDSTDLEMMERTVAQQDSVDANTIREFAHKSEHLNWDENTVDELFEDGRFGNELSNDGERIVGNAMMKEMMQSNSKDDLTSKFGKPVADNMSDAFRFEPDEQKMVEMAENYDSLDRSEVIEGFQEGNDLHHMGMFADTELDNYNAVSNELRWLLNEQNDKYDEKLAQEAKSELQSKNESIVEDAFTRAGQANNDIASVSPTEARELAETVQDAYVNDEMDQLLEDESFQKDLMGAVDLSDSVDDADKAMKGVARTIQKEYTDQVASQVNNSDQIQLDGKTLMDDIDTEQLLDNRMDLMLDDNSDVEVGYENIIPGASVERVEEEIHSQALEYREALIENQVNMDRDEIATSLEQTKEYQNATESGREELVQTTMEQLSSTIDDQVKVLADQEAEVMAEQMNRMSQDIETKMKEDFKLPDAVVNEAMDGQLDPSELQSNINKDHIDGLMKSQVQSHMRDAVEKNFESVADTVDDAIADQINELSEWEISRIQDKPLDELDPVEDLGMSEEQIVEET